MEYAQLLKRARENMPTVVYERERFEMPKVKGHVEGNKTIISNFHQISGTLRRQQEHILKFLLKELATPGEVNRSGLLVLGTKTSATRINQKLKEYVIEFVLCSKCAKPDTEIKKEGEFYYLRCSACGEKRSIKAL